MASLVLCVVIDSGSEVFAQIQKFVSARADLNSAENCQELGEKKEYLGWRQVGRQARNVA